VLQQEDFNRLLNWLAADAEQAGSMYETIRWRLVAILASRGCRFPEDLADETIDRVARRVAQIQSTYVGDKAIYFLGVMNNVHHEYLKRREPPVVPLINDVAAAVIETKEQIHACLEKCLGKLTPNSRQMIEQYYAEDKQAKIDLRKRLAQKFGVSASNLRLRALRIREKLQVCIDRCVEAEALP